MAAACSVPAAGTWLRRVAARAAPAVGAADAPGRAVAEVAGAASGRAGLGPPRSPFVIVIVVSPLRCSSVVVDWQE
jgi:hypothetical protein